MCTDKSLKTLFIFCKQYIRAVFWSRSILRRLRLQQESSCLTSSVSCNLCSKNILNKFLNNVRFPWHLLLPVTYLLRENRIHIFIFNAKKYRLFFIEIATILNFWIRTWLDLLSWTWRRSRWRSSSSTTHTFEIL